MTRAGALGLVIGLAACGGASAPGSEPTPHAGPAPAVAVRRGDLVDRVVLTGDLIPAPAGTIDLQVPAVDRDVSIRWLAEDGATVAAGDRVIEFDNAAFTEGLEGKHLAALEAETTARNAEAIAVIALADKESELKQHEIELVKAQLKAEIPADLLSAHDGQQNQLDRSRAASAVEKAKRDLVATRDSDALEGHVRTLARDKAKRIVDDAEHGIHALVITAPRAGVVVIADHPWQGRKFQIGDNMWPGFTIARLPDATHAMEVHADLSDVDDGRVAIGMAGTCTLDAYPADPVACTVSELTPVARDKSKVSLRRVFAITLTLAKLDTTHQRPGMSVKVVLTRPPLTGALLVPRGALVFADDEAGKVARAHMATGELREVTLGPCDAQTCAIETGLAEGEPVSP